MDQPGKQPERWLPNRVIKLLLPSPSANTRLPACRQEATTFTPERPSQDQAGPQTAVCTPFTLSVCDTLDAGLSEGESRQKTWSLPLRWPHVQRQQHSSKRVSVAGGLPVPPFRSGVPLCACLAILASLHLFSACISELMLIGLPHPQSWRMQCAQGRKCTLQTSSVSFKAELHLTLLASPACRAWGLYIYVLRRPGCLEYVTALHTE